MSPEFLGPKRNTREREAARAERERRINRLIGKGGLRSGRASEIVDKNTERKEERGGNNG